MMTQTTLSPDLTDTSQHDEGCAVMGRLHRESRSRVRPAPTHCERRLPSQSRRPRVRCLPLIALLSALACSKPGEPQLPFGSHKVITAFGEAGHRSRDQWYAALVDQDGTRYCVLATADDRAFATADRLVMQFGPRGERQPFLRFQTYFDSTRVEDRRPTDLERTRGVIWLSDSLFARLAGVNMLTVEVQLGRGSELGLVAAYVFLPGYNALRPLLERPECTR